MANILITGAGGTIGREVAKHLSKKHYLTLVDVDFSEFPKVPEELEEHFIFHETDLTKQANWENLLNGIDYVIQLAADPSPEAEFYESLLELNYKLPYNLFAAAKQAPDLKRIIFASSIHAVDAYPEGTQVKTSDPVRPNDLYGVSKVYLEGLAAHFAYSHDVESIGIRIGDYKATDTELPNRPGPQGFATYLSRRDLNQLIDRCLEAKLKEPFLLVNGLSDNTFNRLDIEQAKVLLDYAPQDNAFEKREFEEE